jgi:hypothetical protein
MLNVDRLVAQPSGLLLRGSERRRCLLGEFVQIHSLS